MSIAICGMHRSGTSMVAKLLHLCGVYLGPESELLQASPDNLDGYWENRLFVELNEDILQATESAWDSPRTVSPDWGDNRFQGLRENAATLVHRFDGCEPWAWKDPRNCINLDFWLHLLPNLKVVVPVRHPLEVALSLRRRGFPSVEKSLRLWLEYNQSVLDVTTRSSRVITHYDAYFARPEAELRRVLDFVGIPPGQSGMAACAGGALTELRHGSFVFKDLSEARVPVDVVELYRALCSEAEWRDEEVHGERAATGACSHHSSQKSRTEVDLLGRVLEAEALRGELRTLRCEKGRIEEAMTDCRGTAEAQALQITALNAALGWWSAVAASALNGVASDSEIVAQFRVQAIQMMARRLLPEDANLVVISKGDPELLKLDGCTVSHFPQAQDGTYAGCYPASSSAAIAHLEYLRFHGADFLLIPSSACWWLDHYKEFAQHLRRQFRALPGTERVCTIFDLRQPAALPAAEPANAAQVALAKCRARLGRPLSILNWNTELDLRQFFPAEAVFSPPGNGRLLSYLDETVDVVAMPPDPDLFGEARRVARLGVLEINPATGQPVAHMALPWLADSEMVQRPSIAIVVRCPRDDRLACRYLQELRNAIAGDERAINLVVIDGPANVVPAAATGDILIFLDSVLPLGDWLSPVLETFDRDETVGVVGGKLLAGPGFLAAAGGVVFADGSLAHFGHGDYQVDDPLYCYVREPDFVGGLAAVRRSLFDQIGGFDAALHSSGFILADMCFAARRIDARVLYQPECLAVALAAPSMSGADDSAIQDADRATFRRKWDDCLGRHASPTSWYDRDVWHALAARDATVEVCP